MKDLRPSCCLQVNVNQGNFETSCRHAVPHAIGDRGTRSLPPNLGTISAWVTRQVDNSVRNTRCTVSDGIRNQNLKKIFESVFSTTKAVWEVTRSRACVHG